MGAHRSVVRLDKDLVFTGEVGGHQIPIGAAPKDGSERKGVSPKALSLTSLAGCTAIDVTEILRKMRQEIDDFSVEAEGEETDDHPRVFREILVTYRVRGKGIERDKVERAVQLSQEKYCGVSAMLGKAVPIKTKVIIEE